MTDFSPVRRPLSRRRLLKLALAAASAPAGLAQAVQTPPSFDIIIIGAGAAGLSAACAALQAAKLRVLVLEKAGFAGGHTLLAGGSVNAVDPVRQSPLHIHDSAELMAQQTFENGGKIADLALVKTLASQSGPVIDWLEDMGVHWSDTVFEAWGGVFPRAHNTGRPRPGFEYIHALMQRARALGAQIRFESRVTQLLSTQQTGLYGVELSNKTQFLARSVIIATGGFTANVAMRTAADPRLGSHMRTTANPHNTAFDGSTGDGIVLGRSLGAELVDMAYIQLLPYSGGRVLDYVGGDIFLNRQGQRFVNEGGTRQSIAQAVLELTDNTFWVLTDALSDKGANFEAKLLSGAVTQAATLRDVARIMSIPTAQLQTTLDRYNGFVRARRDTDFGKRLLRQSIDHPPYYIGRETLDVHFSCGGLKISAQAQVIDSYGHVIDGLYAAGETTGGIHGKDRLGGNALTSAFVFGRIAGHYAATHPR